ncbi:MAG: sulfotransferase [Nannocystaceae bacterium]|nr:sulfotransferase [Myxococcales bacterium]
MTPRPSPAPVRAFNWIARRLDRTPARGRLDPEALLQTHAPQRERLGLAPADADEVVDGFRRLVDSLRDEARLTPFGRIVAQQNLVRLLTTRSSLAPRLRAPPSAKSSLAPPLFIVGLPRTGTTLLHGLLAQDPELRAPLTWEVAYPEPAPTQADRANARDPRRLRARRQLRILDWLRPEFRAIHPMDAIAPQECVAIMAYRFANHAFHVSYDIPAYQAWLDRRSFLAVYREHRRFLAHLQWPEQRGRWLLKSPLHLRTLDALVAIYPEARLVWTHRAPLEVLPSWASLVTSLRSLTSDAVDPRAIAREFTGRWADALDHALATGASIGPRQRLDVSYARLVASPLQTVAALYRHFDLELTPATLARMRSYLAAHHQRRHGVHRYRLADFGLDPDAVRHRFAAYHQAHARELE